MSDQLECKFQSACILICMRQNTGTPALISVPYKLGAALPTEGPIGRRARAEQRQRAASAAQPRTEE